MPRGAFKSESQCTVRTGRGVVGLAGEGGAAVISGKHGPPTIYQFILLTINLNGRVFTMQVTNGECRKILAHVRKMVTVV